MRIQLKKMAACVLAGCMIFGQAAPAAAADEYAGSAALAGEVGSGNISGGELAGSAELPIEDEDLLVGALEEAGESGFDASALEEAGDSSFDAGTEELWEGSSDSSEGWSLDADFDGQGYGAEVEYGVEEAEEETPDGADDEGNEAALADEAEELLVFTDADESQMGTEMELSGVPGEDGVMEEEDLSLEFEIEGEESMEFSADEPMLYSTRKSRGFLVGAGEDFVDFYSQLTPISQGFYTAFYEHFGQNRQTAELKISYTVDTAPFTWKCPVYKNENNKWAIDKESEEYKEGKVILLKYQGAAFQANIVDHPEIFWIKNSTSVFSPGGANVVKEGDSYYCTVYPTYVSFKTSKTYFLDSFYSEQTYPDLETMIAAFDIAVQETAQKISAESDYNRDGTVEAAELLQGVHDYVAETCWYDREALNAESTTGDKKIRTPVGAFLERAGSGMVCEGYSKAFKILCDRLGITCCLVNGKASATSTDDHEWNAVKMDGEWFLVDVTWDDGDKIKYTYYMRYGVAGRVVFDQIGGYAAQFPYIPSAAEGSHTLNQVVDEVTAGCITCTTYSCGESNHPNLKRYEVTTNHVEKTVGRIEPTCTEDGLTEGSECSVCGDVLKKQTVIPALGHTEETVPGKPATCTETGLTDGTKCLVCGAVLKEQTLIPALGHTEETVPGKPATCTETGLTDGSKCSVCGLVLKEQAVIPAGHKVVLDQPVQATTSSTGLTAGTHCSVCGAILTAQTVVPMVTVTLKVTAKGLKNKKVSIKKGKTLQLKATSNAEVKYSSSNKKVAAVSKTGKITAKKKGTATITVKAGTVKSNMKTVKITVTVK